MFTGDELEITEELFETIERRVVGVHSENGKRKDFRKEVQNLYATKTLAQEDFTGG